MWAYLNKQNEVVLIKAETGSPEWVRLAEKGRKRVALTKIGQYQVSTVFLRINHGFGSKRGLWFETMVFPTNKVDYQTRCETWEQALEMHKKAVKMVQKIVKLEK